jgi:hypothetical protein
VKIVRASPIHALARCLLIAGTDCRCHLRSSRPLAPKGRASGCTTSPWLGSYGFVRASKASSVSTGRAGAQTPVRPHDLSYGARAEQNSRGISRPVRKHHTGEPPKLAQQFTHGQNACRARRPADRRRRLLNLSSRPALRVASARASWLAGCESQSVKLRSGSETSGQSGTPGDSRPAAPLCAPGLRAVTRVRRRQPSV